MTVFEDKDTSTWTTERADWEVMWLKVRDGDKYIVCKEFGNDFVGARDLYVKALQAGKKMVTLRCCNVAFAPPEKYHGKMAAYNRQGVWWCPYCCELRRFERVDGYHSELIDEWVNDPGRYECPMCDISQENGFVQRWNPIARKLVGRKKRRSG